MALSVVELSLHRKGTESFIAADTTTILLTSKAEVWAGGTKTLSADTDREPQDFKVIWSGSDGIVPHESGTTRRFDFILVGKYDAEVAIGDFWDIEDQHNVIEYVYPFNGYEVKCGGKSYGSNPSG
jgi:hypothetical protein